MKPSRELFDLIKSMSGSEKRYFKLSVSLQKGSKNYLTLFDVIESQKNFDEDELRKIIKDKSVNKNLTITKNYLYKLIIKILTRFRNKTSIDLKLNLILSRCKLMYEKGLFQQYFKTIKTGKDAALKYERFTILLDFIELEKNLIKKDEIGKKNMDLIYEHESEVLEWIRISSHYKKIVTKLFSILRTKGIVRDSETDSEITQLCSEIIPFQKSKKLPVRAGESMLLAKYLEMRLKGKFEESVEFCKLRYMLVSKNPDIFRDYLLDPEFDSLEFYITSALKLKNFKEAKSVYSRLKKLIGNSRDIDLTVTGYDIRLSEYIENENTKEGDLLIPEIEDFFKRHSGKILVNTENYFKFNIAKYYLAAGNFLQARRVINEFLSNRYSKLTPEFESYSRILNILIHYELGSYSLLKYLIPATKKFLIGKKKYFKFESEIFKSINKLAALENGAGAGKIYRELFKKILQLKKDKYERNAFFYIEAEKWIGKKLLNQK